MAGTPRIAIVGGGPSGFYAAEALLRSIPDCQIDLIERLPAPHGLVRYGVAPDHQKLKQVSAVFDTIAQDPRFTMYAGVCVGDHVSLYELMGCYHAVVLATGNAVGRTLGVPGETLAQIYTSAQFAGWYNGHPDYAALQPDLSGAIAAVIGNGNVSLDVCRLLVRSIGDLRASDIPEPMLRSFECRGVREVHVLGRGAVTGTKFSFKEFRQLADLPGLQIRVPQAVHWIEETWSSPASDDAARVAQWLRANGCNEPRADHTIVNFWFQAVPAGFLGTGRVRSIRFENASGGAWMPEVLPCNLTVTCIGYDWHPLPGVPVDPGTGKVRHSLGQVLDEDGADLGGLFVTGWAKRGPTGIIGTNRADSVETAQSLVLRLARLVKRLPADAPTLGRLLGTRSVSPVSHTQWLAIDRWEKNRGAVLGKPREKLLSGREVIELLRSGA